MGVFLEINPIEKSGIGWGCAGNLKCRAEPPKKTAAISIHITAAVDDSQLSDCEKNMSVMTLTPAYIDLVRFVAVAHDIYAGSQGVNIFDSPFYNQGLSGKRIHIVFGVFTYELLVDCRA